MRLRTLILTVSLATVAWSQTYRVATYAGGGAVDNGGLAVNAYLSDPEQTAFDKAGNLYICDTGNHRVRLVSPDGNIRTFAGNGERGQAGDGGQATAAQLNSPRGIVIDASGVVWIGELNRFRLVLPNGEIRTAAVGAFGSLQGMALHPDGSVYASNGSGNQVLRATSAGAVTAVAGTGVAGYSGDGGPAANARLNFPWGIAIDSQGTLFIADYINSVVRKVQGGNITTVIGNGQPLLPTSGQAATAAVPFPSSVLLDVQGNLVVGAIQLMRYASAGTGVLQLLSTTANYGFAGDGGSVATAQFEAISSLTQAPDQSLIISDNGNHRIRRVNSLGIVSTIAGADRSAFQGPAISATISPNGLAADARGNLYIGHNLSASGAILRVDSEGRISKFAGSGAIRPVQNGGPANASGMKPRAVAIAPDESVLYSESDSIDRQAVRRVRDGRVEAVAGKVKTSNNATLIVSGNTGDGGPGESALLNDPYGVWADAGGTVYIADGGNRRVRKVTGSTISAFAGNGVNGFSGDGGSAPQAAMRFPVAVIGDRRGNIYISDYSDHRIRRVTPAGVISTFAGNGLNKTSGDGGPAAQAGIPFPYYMAFDALDNLYVTSNTNVIRKIDGNGGVTTIAGNGDFAQTGDGGPALQASFLSLAGLAVAPDGRIFAADVGRVRVLTPVASGGGGGGTSSKALAITTATDNQTGAPGSTLARPLTVRFTDNNQPGAGVPVDFAVVLGSATLSAARVITGTDGTASVTVTLGATPGVSRIRASAQDATPVEFVVTALRNDGVAQVRQVVTASAFGGDTRIAPGTWVEISGSNLSATTREWGGADFKEGVAPTTLDGVSVSIGGRPAFVRYISPGQVNVQIPFDVALGPQALRVTTAAGSSDAVTMQVAARVPGLLAPPDSFAIGGRQYLAALFADGVFVLPPGAIAGLTTRRAKAGDRILVYAIGCGATTPEIAAGVGAPGATLPGVTARIGNANAVVEYAGTSPGAIGLYQFNLVVPAGVSGDVPLTMSIGGVAVAQQLVLATE